MTRFPSSFLALNFHISSLHSVHLETRSRHISSVPVVITRDFIVNRWLPQFMLEAFDATLLGVGGNPHNGLRYCDSLDACCVLGRNAQLRIAHFTAHRAIITTLPVFVCRSYDVMRSGAGSMWPVLLPQSVIHLYRVFLLVLKVGNVVIGSKKIPLLSSFCA